MVGLEQAGMAIGATGLAIKQVAPECLVLRQLGLAPQRHVKKAVRRPPFKGDKGRDCIGNIGEMHRLCANDLIKPRAVFGNTRHPLRQDVPGPARSGHQPLTHCPGHIAFAQMSGHFVGRQHGEHGLRAQQAGKALLHLGPQRRANAARPGLVQFQPAVMKERPVFQRTDVEQRGRIAWNAVGGHVRRINHPRRPQPMAPVAQSQRQPVARGKPRMVAGGTADGLAPRQDGIVKQQPPQFDLRHVRHGKLCVGCRQVTGQRGSHPDGQRREIASDREKPAPHDRSPRHCNAFKPAKAAR